MNLAWLYIKPGHFTEAVSFAFFYDKERNKFYCKYYQTNLKKMEYMIKTVKTNLNFFLYEHS
jgi:hypothetical protein